jgi:hypothetical protein
MATDMLANVERFATEETATAEVSKYPGYWHGPAVLYGERWKARALAAEAELAALRASVAAAWRYRP